MSKCKYPTLERLMALRGYNVPRLATATGIHVRTLRRKMAGEYPWSVTEMQSVAKVLDIPRDGETGIGEVFFGERTPNHLLSSDELLGIRSLFQNSSSTIRRR